MAIQKLRIEFDILWKDIIELFIDEFVDFFMADLYPKIDFKQVPVFKDKELDKIFGDGKPKDVRRCDKLVQLHLKDGNKCWILVHIEVQQELNNTLPKRMFRYFYRIYDRYEEKSKGIEAIAILLNRTGKNKYNTYKYEYGKTTINYNYRTFALFETSEEELIRNKNVFSIVILASRYAIQFKDDEKRRTAFKFKLARLAFERKYDKQKIVDLLGFVYYVINLSDEEETKFKNTVNIKLDAMEPRTITFKEGMIDFLANVYGYDFDITAYIPKEMHNNALEQARRKEEEAHRKEEEAHRKEEEAHRKEEEALKKEAQLLKSSITAFYKNNYSPDQIADILQVDKQKVIEVVEKIVNSQQ